MSSQNVYPKQDITQEELESKGWEVVIDDSRTSSKEIKKTFRKGKGNQFLIWSEGAVACIFGPPEVD